MFLFEYSIHMFMCPSHINTQSLHQCNDVEVPSASNALPFLPPNYCPQDCRQFGGVSNGNFLGQAVFTENESKPPQRKRARKKVMWC